MLHQHDLAVTQQAKRAMNATDTDISDSNVRVLWSAHSDKAKLGLVKVYHMQSFRLYRKYRLQN